MFVINIHSLICLMTLLQHSLSTPVAYDFSNADPMSDFSVFNPEAQTEAPWEDTNLLALSTNDADTNLFDYSPSDSADWAFSPTQADENSLPTFNDMIFADSGAVCPLGRKRDGGRSCAADEQAPSGELPNLQLPDLLGTFGIVDEKGGSTTTLDEPKSDANAVTGSLSQPDPCIVNRFLHNLHVCCDGPLDSLPSRSNVYPWIKGCALGK